MTPFSASISGELGGAKNTFPIHKCVGNRTHIRARAHTKATIPPRGRNSTCHQLKFVTLFKGQRLVCGQCSILALPTDTAVSNPTQNTLSSLRLSAWPSLYDDSMWGDFLCLIEQLGVSLQCSPAHWVPFIVVFPTPTSLLSLYFLSLLTVLTPSVKSIVFSCVCCGRILSVIGYLKITRIPDNVTEGNFKQLLNYIHIKPINFNNMKKGIKSNGNELNNLRKIYSVRL